MPRYVSDPKTVNFSPMYQVLAKYDDVGWDLMDVFCDRDQARKKIAERIECNEFKEDEMILREVAVSTTSFSDKSVSSLLLIFPGEDEED